MLSRRLVCSLLPLLFLACRDEQAGPRPKSAPRTSSAPVSRVLSEPPADLTFRSRATWARGALQFLGARVVGPGPDGAVRVSSYFRATGAVPDGFALFMHLVDADSGQAVGNADHPLSLPEGRWPRDQVIEDNIQLRVPADRSLEVRLGFFRGDERLPIDDPATHDGEMRAIGPHIGRPARPLPVYAVKRRRTPIRIDGVLDEEAWRLAAPAILTNSMDGSPVAHRTLARILYDDDALYVAFDCEDDDVWGTFRKRDEALYTEEVVEIFLDASADGRTYQEIELSPHNVLFDAYFPARRQGMDLSWDSGTESAVQVRGTLDKGEDYDRGWSGEMRIPLAKLRDLEPGKKLSGTRWRANLYRLEHPRRRGVEGQAWSPLFVGDFHALPRFGWLAFE